MANPIKIIRDDHRNVEKLFKHYEDLDQHAYETKYDIALQIISELRLHGEMEETIFYPPCKEILKQEKSILIEEAIAEHDVIKKILEDIEMLESSDPQFDAKVKILNENVAHHIKEEEEEVLPIAEQKLGGSTLEQLGDTMVQFKEEKSRV